MTRIPAELEAAYEIVEQLHRGSSGTLYRVRHRLLGDLRIAKVLQPRLDDPVLRSKFIARAQAVSRLSHPNIARLFDFSIDDGGLAHVVLEYVEGVSLEGLVAAGEPPPLGLGLRIARQVLRAVGHLHRHEVIHRHLSADNLVLARHVEGGPDVKLVEPGLVPQLDDKTAPPRSWPLSWLRYAAPEMLSEGPRLPQSDLYSVGVVFYQLFTGRHPIAGSSAPELIAGHLTRSPLEFARSDPQRRLPAELRRLLLATLAKEAAARPRDAASMLRSLELLQATVPYDRGDLEVALDRAAAGPQTVDSSATTLAAANLEAISTVVTPAAPPKPAVADQPTLVVASRSAPTLGAFPSPAIAGANSPQGEAQARQPVPASPASSAKIDRQERRRARRQRFERLCREAGELRAKGYLEQALEKARTALDISFSDPEARRLAVEIEHQLANRPSTPVAASDPDDEERTVTGQRLPVTDTEIDQVVATIRRQLAERRPASAMQTLQAALARYGARAELIELRHQIAQNLLEDDAHSW